MFDVTEPTWLENNPWYDPAATDNDRFNAYVEDQKRPEYTLGDYTGDPATDMWLYGDLKVKAKQETEKVSLFNTDKEAAFVALATQQDQERIDLGATWQAKEDAGWDVDHIPYV